MDVREVLLSTSTWTQGLATHAGLLRNGVPRAVLSRAVSDGLLVRVRRGVYAAEPLPPLPRHLVTDEGLAPPYALHVRAVLLSLGGGAAASRRTAAACYGWGLLVEPGRTVEVAFGHGRGAVLAPGVRAEQRRTSEVVRRRVLPGTAALRLTSPVQTVLDCARTLPLLQAVVVADSALRAGDVTVEELQDACAALRGRDGVARARRAIDLCDPSSGSVLETVLRVRLQQAGVTGWRSQLLVRDAVGQHLRVDLAFPSAGLVVEADGARWHPDPARDQARDNALAVLGWRVLRFTWRQVVHEPEAVTAAVLAALACSQPTRQVSGHAAA